MGAYEDYEFDLSSKEREVLFYLFQDLGIIPKTHTLEQWNPLSDLESKNLGFSAYDYCFWNY